MLGLEAAVEAVHHECVVVEFVVEAAAVVAVAAR